jgi:hypothetical protein
VSPYPGQGNPAAYTSWSQLSGYFDGDGNVGLEVAKRVLRFKIRFVDTWRPQIDSIASFLAQQGIACGCVGKGDKRGTWQAAYRLDIVEVDSVLKTAKSMLMGTVKKRTELQAVIDYLEGRKTGNQILEVFNEAVKAGRRRGKVRFEDLPLTREEGLRLSQLENARDAREAYAVNVSAEIQSSIREDHRELGLGHILLSRKYGYSVSVIRRILGER